MKRLSLISLLAATALASSLPAARAAITTSGGASFQTGTPTPTLSITAPITFTINLSASGGTAVGNIPSFLVFDEWTTSNGAEHGTATSPSMQSLSFTLNGTTAYSQSIGNLSDNLARTLSSITPNDGFLFLSGSGRGVATGDTLMVGAGTFTFAVRSGFNPLVPVGFTGNAYLTDAGGTRISNLVSVSAVPEPSTWACVAAGAGLLGFVTLRRRSTAVRA